MLYLTCFDTFNLTRLIILYDGKFPQNDFLDDICDLQSSSVVSTTQKCSLLVFSLNLLLVLMLLLERISSVCDLVQTVIYTTDIYNGTHSSSAYCLCNCHIFCITTYHNSVTAGKQVDSVFICDRVTCVVSGNAEVDSMYTCENVTCLDLSNFVICVFLLTVCATNPTKPPKSNKIRKENNNSDTCCFCIAFLVQHIH